MSKHLLVSNVCVSKFIRFIMYNFIEAYRVGFGKQEIETYPVRYSLAVV